MRFCGAALTPALSRGRGSRLQPFGVEAVVIWRFVAEWRGDHSLRGSSIDIAIILTQEESALCRFFNTADAIRYCGQSNRCVAEWRGDHSLRGGSIDIAIILTHEESLTNYEGHIQNAVIARSGLVYSFQASISVRPLLLPGLCVNTTRNFVAVCCANFTVFTALPTGLSGDLI